MGSLWIIVGRCGSLWVVPGFSNYAMFSRDSDEGKVKYCPLYGRGIKVTILVSRHFQSGMLPIEKASKKT